jgi:hypothetical protein
MQNQHEAAQKLLTSEKKVTKDIVPTDEEITTKASDDDMKSVAKTGVMQLDLGSMMTVTSFRVKASADGTQDHMRKFKVEVSDRKTTTKAKSDDSVTVTAADDECEWHLACEGELRSSHGAEAKLLVSKELRSVQRVRFTLLDDANMPVTGASEGKQEEEEEEEEEGCSPISLFEVCGYAGQCPCEEVRDQSKVLIMF